MTNTFDALKRDYEKIVATARDEFPDASIDLLEAAVYEILSHLTQTDWTKRLCSYHGNAGLGRDLDNWMRD